MIYRLICTIYRPEKTTKKVTKNWNWPFLISQQLKISNINTGHKSQMVWKRHNLQTRGIIYRLNLFNCRPEKSLNKHKLYKSNFWYTAILKSLKYKFMFKLLGISEVKGSTYTIYWPTKRDWKSDFNNLQTRWKQAKKVLESWNWTFHKWQYQNPSNIHLASVSEHVRKKLWNLLTWLKWFTDQQK